MTKFAVLIPAYNEEKTIKELVERILPFAPNVIVVNDASTDNTKKQLDGLPVKYVEHTHNLGKASALNTGFTLAREMGVEAVITIDGDSQHDPGLIPTLIKAFEAHPNSFIIASRLINRENAPAKRRRANDIADFWVSWAASVPIKDSQSGYRVYPTSLLKKMTKHYDKSSGFVFESEVLIQASRLGFSFVFVPVISCYPKNNRASHFRPVFDITQITLMVAKHLASRGFNLPGLYCSLRKHPVYYPPKLDS